MANHAEYMDRLREILSLGAARCDDTGHGCRIARPLRKPGKDRSGIWHSRHRKLTTSCKKGTSNTTNGLRRSFFVIRDWGMCHHACRVTKTG